LTEILHKVQNFRQKGYRTYHAAAGEASVRVWHAAETVRTA